MAKNPPTIRMRRLGSQLRKIREERGLTLDEAADLLKLSKSALSRMETAQVITRRHEVDYLLLQYQVTDDDLRESLLGLAGAGRSKDWIKRHESLGRPAGDLVRLEQDSSAIRTFQAIVVPGLLQTPDYARTVMQQVEYAPPQDPDRSVAYRMARQEVLTRPDSAELKAVIWEAALQQRLGSAEIVRAQLRHLMIMSERANVSIRVLPFEAARHPGVDGSFSLLDVEAGNFTIAVIDSLARTAFVENDVEVSRYVSAFDDLWATALAETESRAAIKTILSKLETSPDRE